MENHSFNERISQKKDEVARLLRVIGVTLVNSC